jgi:N-carbamoyl-L-amino-acid hydrolase
MRHGFSEAELGAMVGRDGERLLDALTVWPWSTGSPTETRVDPRRIHAFVELHIEQGARLEDANTEIGVVTAIVGLGSAHVTFIGDVDHAGTTKMNARRDALIAAADFVARVPDIPRAVGPDSVATAGWMRLHPNAANVVPGRAEVSLDFRDLSLVNVERMRDELEQLARRIAAQRGLEVRWNAHPIISPAPLDEQVQLVIGHAAAERKLSSMRLPSGAGHDSQNMAPLAPTGMIFIPSVGGRSHSPAELTLWPDILNGANVLLNTMTRLAGM